MNKIYHAIVRSLPLLILTENILAAEEELYFEIPVVLSASRLEQPVSDAPVAITVIDRQLIEASGARNIPDVLRIVPGMIVARAANEFGDEPKYAVAYHGHSDQYSRRMQVLIDGRSIYEPVLGGVNWNMIPINLNDIERIEVSRGPNAASYGANSFLAVVNIITRHAAEDHGHYVQINAGNHEIRDVTYRFAGSNDDDLDYRATFSSQHDDGQDRADGIENHDGVLANAIDYRLDYQANNRNTITYQGGIGSTTQEVERNNATLGIRPQRDSDNLTAHQFIKWENTFDSNNTFVLQYYLNFIDKDDVSTSELLNTTQLAADGELPAPFSLIDPFTIPLDFSLTSRRNNLEFTHYFDGLDDTRIIWGASAQLDNIDSPYFIGTGNSINRRTYRLFTNIEHQFNDRHIFQIGALYEDNDFAGDETSPRASYIFKPTEKQSIRYSISKAIRQPFILESDANAFFSKQLTTNGGPLNSGVAMLLGNTDVLFYQQLLASGVLRTESIISRELGYYASLLDDDLHFNARIFNDDLKDLIDTDTIFDAPMDNLGIGTTTFVNANSSNIQGIEIEFDYYAGRAIRLAGSAAYQDIESSEKRLVESAPKRSASLISIFKLNENYNISGALYYVGDMGFTDVNNSSSSGQITTGGYRKLDIKLSRYFTSTDYDGSVSLVFQNLLDEYNEYDALPTNGPLLENNLTWYIELRLQSN